MVHALAIALGFGLLFMLAVLGGGHWLDGAMGGSGASLAAALTYSNVLFSGAILIGVFNAALAAFGLITAGAVATGAWFGPLVWPRPRVLAPSGRPFGPVGCGSTRSAA